MLSPRIIDIEADKDALLEMHCIAYYECESPIVRRTPFDKYRDKWLSTKQTGQFMEALSSSMADKRTIAEIWEDQGRTVGYLWVTFYDEPDYNITVAEVRDMVIGAGKRRQGIGRKLLEHAEELAQERGADIMRSCTGIDNTASQKLHESADYKTYHIEYEKLLNDRAFIQEE